MVAFKPTRPTPVSRGRNEGMNFGNVSVESRTGGGGGHGGGGVTGKNIYFFLCGWDYMKRYCPKRAEDKQKKQ